MVVLLQSYTMKHFEIVDSMLYIKNIYKKKTYIISNSIFSKNETQ